MARRRKTDDVFLALDPLGKYPEMMGTMDVAEFAGISSDSARKWIQEHNGVLVIKGVKRDTWKVHKEYVRRGFNLPRITA